MKTFYECSIDQLRDEGYAVVIFTPEELNGANPDEVENSLVEVGREIIRDHQKNDGNMFKVNAVCVN
jgi:hypothetical protein